MSTHTTKQIPEQNLLNLASFDEKLRGNFRANLLKGNYQRDERLIYTQNPTKLSQRRRTITKSALTESILRKRWRKNQFWSKSKARSKNSRNFTPQSSLYPTFNTRSRLSTKKSKKMSLSRKFRFNFLIVFWNVSRNSARKFKAMQPLRRKTGMKMKRVFWFPRWLTGRIWKMKIIRNW